MRIRIHLLFALVAAALGLARDVCAAGLGTNTATSFFNDTAGLLLASELQVNLGELEVYPSNQYTSPVHRLLQLTANLYDAMTNRADLTGYPHLPTVFRPLFRRDPDGTIYIAGYREVADARMADPATAPVLVDLEDDAGRAQIPPTGTAVDPDDRNEPMIWGIPLLIGVKKGYPNFNEFSMQNQLMVTRRLEFRRPDGGDPNLTSIVETNQLYLVTVSNVFGIEAWNSYSSPFPRDLQLLIDAEITAVLTSDAGVLFSNRYEQAANLLIPAGTWPGFLDEQRRIQPSLLIPITNSIPELPPSAWRPNGNPQLVPVPVPFDRGLGFPVPHWFFSLGARVQFRLVDTSVTPNRIVDYVNLSRKEATLDVASIMQAEGGYCGFIDSTGAGNPWCTNRFGGPNPWDVTIPTYGILNQFVRNVSHIDPSQGGFVRYAFDTNTGGTWQAAVQSFINQFLPPGISVLIGGNQPTTRSNIFYTPFNPVTAIYQHVTWQANDPLVHYTMADLLSPCLTNVDSISRNPPLDNIGRLNSSYEPWDFHNPLMRPSSTLVSLSVKDPLVRRSDDWDFPEQFYPSVGWLGRVHRGTPWQTVYLKSLVDTNAWWTWLRIRGTTNAIAAMQMEPANDWRLPGLLFTLLQTNSLEALHSINDPDPNNWRAVLNGMSILTNTTSWAQLTTTGAVTFDVLVMTSNSPEAEIIADGIEAVRGSRPGGYFRDIGELLAVPQLSVLSPWLATNSPGFSNSVQTSMTLNDEAYEILPGELLSKVRTDSIGSVVPADGALMIQFTGYDGYAYAIQCARNMKHWQTLELAYPTNGVIRFTVPPPLRFSRLLYRSVLFPDLKVRGRRQKFLFNPTGPVFIGGDESRRSGRGQGHADAGAHE